MRLTMFIEKCYYLSTGAEMMRTVFVAAGLAVAIAGAPGSSAHAQLVQNGGFEADTITTLNPAISPPTDWLVDPGGNAGVDSTSPHTLNNDAYIGSDPNGNPSTLSQTINGLVINGQYIVDFWLDADFTGDQSATFDAMLGDQDLVGGTPISAAGLIGTGYNEYSVTLTADAASPDLVFTAASDAGNFLLDDVSINAVGVPEPMSALVLASAIGAFTLVRRRRRA